MATWYLTLHLKSDATFGSGQGIPGLVDVEIEHDEKGCPFFGGRALKGLLVEEWENIRFALGKSAESWKESATRLFGNQGAMRQGIATMHVGNATLPPALLALLHNDTQLSSSDVLNSLTTIRRQTAMNAETGVPQEHSLRSMRVLLRDTPLIASLGFDTPPTQDDLALLAACVLGVRRAGTGRNRGRGHVALLLHDQEPNDYYADQYTKTLFDHFATSIRQPIAGGTP